MNDSENDNMTQRMYDALNGNHPVREGTMFEAEMVRPFEIKYGDEIEPDGPVTLDAYEFKHKCWPDSRGYWHFSGMIYNTALQEAIILIPEDEGHAKIRRVHSPRYMGKSGFFNPEYTEKGLNSLVAAYSMKFAEEGDIYNKAAQFHPLFIILNEDQKKAFSNQRDRIIEGIKSSHYAEDDPHKANKTALDIFARITKEMGIDHKADKEFMQTFWCSI